jgi:phage terminase large subunit
MPVKTAEPQTLTIKTPRVFLPLLQPSRYKGVFGGRGGAKSHAFADLLLERCFLHQPCRAVCIREYQRSLEQSVKRLLEDKIQTYGLGRQFRVMNTHIETPGGGLVIFEGMQTHTAESIKSLEAYDVAWVEEAQSLSQRSLDLLRPTIREEASELWFSWNPRYPTDPVDKLLRHDPPPDSIVIRTNYPDNPFFPEVLRKEMEWDRKRDPEKYAHVWLGEYERHSESRVFHNWRVEEFETPADVAFLFGGDWGFAADPDVLVRCYVVGRTLYVDAEAYEIGCEIDQTPFLFDTVGCRACRPHSPCNGTGDGHGMARRWEIIADSARPETISYMQHHGYPRIIPAKKGPGSIEEGVQFLKNYDIIVHPRCAHVIDELTTYSFKRNTLTDQILPQLEDKKNHVIDALRYAVEKLRLVFDYAQAGMTSEATW